LRDHIAEGDIALTLLLVLNTVFLTQTFDRYNRGAHFLKSKMLELET